MRRTPVLAGIALAAVVAAVWLWPRGEHAREDHGAPPAPIAEPGPAPTTGGDGAGSADESDLGELLETQGGELGDLLGHLHETCERAGGQRARDLDVRAVERCVADAEAAASLVESIRETVESPAGTRMPAEVRLRWTRTLEADASSVRAALHAALAGITQALASGPPPAAARSLGHLRDRADRVLADLGRP